MKSWWWALMNVICGCLTVASALAGNPAASIKFFICALICLGVFEILEAIESGEV